ncbi:MAG: CRISPR-associated endonuclease Cas2 [Monoglobaceae bacterium]
MDRKGVLMVMFDLPVTDKKQQKAYRKFRKYLQQKGYRRIQESVYVKLLHNIINAEKEISETKLAAPFDSSVQILPLSLHSFKKMTAVRGAAFDMELFSDDIVYL